MLAGACRLLFIVNGCFEAARIWEVIAIRSWLFSMKDHQRTETRSTVDGRGRDTSVPGAPRTDPDERSLAHPVLLSDK